MKISLSLYIIIMKELNELQKSAPEGNQIFFKTHRILLHSISFYNMKIFLNVLLSFRFISENSKTIHLECK